MADFEHILLNMLGNKRAKNLENGAKCAYKPIFSYSIKNSILPKMLLTTFLHSANEFTYLEFSTCSTCLHQKKSYVVVRIIDLLMTLMTSVRGVHYIRTVTPILGHGSVKVSSF